MSISPEKQKKLEDTLREGGFMDADDTIEKVEKGDYYPTYFNQVRGTYHFTQKKIIFISGWGLHSFAIKYEDILSIEKSFIGPFMPFGVTITVNTEADDSYSSKKYKLSLLGRAKWIAYISEKSDVSAT